MSEKNRMTGAARSRLVAGAALIVTVGVALAMMTVVEPASVKAGNEACDFVTGGGFIIHRGEKANFGVGGGCKHGTPTWGHLEYIDHGLGLNVHWTSITAYLMQGGTGTDPKTGKPTGRRVVCGTARTNLFGDVDFAVGVGDFGEPGVNDQFDIRLKKMGVVVYDTTRECFPHYLGSSAPCAPGNGGGGNIQLHKPNPSTTGSFGGSCPGF